MTFTRDGMAETRRAILALREGSDVSEAGAAAPTSASAGAGAAAPGTAVGARAGARTAPTRLVTQLRALTEQYQAADDVVIDFEVIGVPRPVGAEVALTAYRTAQESLTNARKHAPGQPVTLGVTFTADELEVQVANVLPPDGAARPLAVRRGLAGSGRRCATASGRPRTRLLPGAG